MNATTLVIVSSVTTGDIFRIFPDGTACEVAHEWDLDEPDHIAALTPTTHDTAKFLAAGTSFERITYFACAWCDGTGMQEGPIYVTVDEDGYAQAHCADERCFRNHKRPAHSKYVESGCHPCCHCKGSGVQWDWQPGYVTRADLPKAEDAA